MYDHEIKIHIFPEAATLICHSQIVKYYSVQNMQNVKGVEDTLAN